MSKVVIDTNILYSLVGLSVNSKVSQSNIEAHDLAVTTATVIEAIVKNRSNLLEIQSCLRPIVEEQYELIQVGHAPVDTSDIKALYCARSLPEVEEILAETVNFKIQRESEFLRFLLIAVAVGVSEVMEALGYQFQDPGKIGTHQALNQAAIAGNVDHWLERFDVVLRAGYSQGVEQQAACDAFTDQLGALILTFVFNFHVTKCGGPIGGGAALLDGPKLTQSVKEDPYRKKRY